MNACLDSFWETIPTLATFEAGVGFGLLSLVDKITKEPLDAKLNVAKRLGSKVSQKGYNISLFAATGAADR